MYDFSSIDGPLVVFDVPYTHKTRRDLKRNRLVF